MNFVKISATGNDFILFDNRDARFTGRERDFFRRICQRRISVGADGVILIQPSDQADFEYVHINSDGSIAEMCGNGARGVAYYAFVKGIANAKMRFEVNGVIHQASVQDNQVKLHIPPPTELQLKPGMLEDDEFEEGGFIKVGVPHYVLFTNCVDTVDVFHIGRKYRNHPAFQPTGTNVNFVQIMNSQNIKIRTYERGVEEETLACGTGTVASSITARLIKGLSVPIEIHTRGGELRVDFNDDFSHVTLEGQVHIIYEGKLLEIGN